MKKIFLFLITTLPFFVLGQNPRVFTVKCNVAQSGGGAGYWQVSATNINDPLGLYDATEIASGDALYLNDGGVQYKLNITTVVSAVGNSATFRVSNTGVTGISSVPTTSAVISRGTPNHELLPWAANISDADNQANQEWNNYLIDSLLNTIGNSYVKIAGDSMTGVLGIKSNDTPGYYPEDFSNQFIYGLDIGKTPNPDSSQAGLGVKNYINRVNVDSTTSIESFSGTFFMYPHIPTGKNWKLGQATGVYVENLRNYNPANSTSGLNGDNGKIGLLTGARMLYGHYNSDLTATPQTTTAIGLNVYPYIQRGNITTMMDIYLQNANSSGGGTVTNHYGIYQQDATIKNYFGGQISVGSETPFGEIQATQTTTNATDFGIVSEITKTTTSSGAHSAYNYYSTTYPKVNSGQTNSGSVVGVYSEILRNSFGTSDNGTLTNLFGERVLYGNNNTDASATPVTTNVYGHYLYPFAKKGTITNLYDLYIANPFSGGTVTNHWAIYQQDATASNYFGGKIQFAGGVQKRTRNVTSNYAVVSGDYNILVNASSGNVTITLPDAATIYDGVLLVGQEYWIQRTDNSVNTVTVIGDGSDTINGSTSFTIASQWEAYQIQATSATTFSKR